MKRLALLIVLCIMGMVSFAQDIQELQARAEQGDAEAQFELFRRYANGNGVDVDNTIAVGYLVQAAENDHPEALYELGCCYMDGTMGLPVWKEKAKGYLFRAMELGVGDVNRLFDLSEGYDWQAKSVRKAVYKQTLLVAPQEKHYKYTENKRDLIRR